MADASSSGSRAGVLDASAILAYLKGEPGAPLARRWMSTGFVSSVNWSEVLQKAVTQGGDFPDLIALPRRTGLVVVGFDEGLAGVAASLYPIGKPIGMSFADRACIATAADLGLAVLTSDRRWSDIALPVQVQQLR